MKNMLLLAALLVAMAASVIADTRFYDYTDAGWKSVGKASGGSGNYWVFCVDGVCGAPRVDCNVCHGSSQRGEYSAAIEKSHYDTYFRKLALTLAEGQQVTAGSVQLRRLNGVLVVQDRRGRRYEFPRNAYIVANSTRQPGFVIYQGAQPPSPVGSAPPLIP